jgi:hypothetical protein
MSGIKREAPVDKELSKESAASGLRSRVAGLLRSANAIGGDGVALTVIASQSCLCTTCVIGTVAVVAVGQADRIKNGAKRMCKSILRTEGK